MIPINLIFIFHNVTSYYYSEVLDVLKLNL